MRKGRMTMAAVFLAVVFLTACGADAADGKNEAGELACFSQEDAAVIPEIREYSFKEVREAGTVQELRGMLPGASEGTWYIASVDGVEYYYGAYDFEEGEDAALFGYAIFSDAYSLGNGITVGMTQEELLAAYPNMAVIDFEGNNLREDGNSSVQIGNMGWNATAYPRSSLGMDSEWAYGGKDYVWSDQFDDLMIAQIDRGEADVLPLYVGLLMKEHVVYAITFYYPTAG